MCKYTFAPNVFFAYVQANTHAHTYRREAVVIAEGC